MILENDFNGEQPKKKKLDKKAQQDLFNKVIQPFKDKVQEMIESPINEQESRQKIYEATLEQNKKKQKEQEEANWYNNRISLIGREKNKQEQAIIAAYNEQENEWLKKEYARIKYGNEDAQMQYEDMTGFLNFKDEYYKLQDPKRNPNHKNHTDSPFTDLVKTNWELGEVEQQLKTGGYTRNDLSELKYKLNRLKVKLKENKAISKNKDETIAIQYNELQSVLDPNEKADLLLKMNWGDGETVLYDDVQLTEEQINRYIDQATIKLARNEQHIEKYKEQYYDYNEKIADFSKQGNALTSGAGNLIGGLSQVGSDSYKARNMALAFGISAASAGIASAAGGSALTVGVIDWGGDVLVDMSQDLMDKKHLIYTLEQRKLTPMEIRDTLAMSAFQSVVGKIAFMGIGKGVKYTVKGGSRLIGNISVKVNEGLLDKMRIKFQKYLPDSMLEGTFDNSYRYNPLTGNIDEVNLPRSVVRGIQDAASEIDAELQDDIIKSFNEDPFSIAKRKQDIAANAMRGDRIDTHTKVEVQEAVDELGKEFEVATNFKKKKAEYEIEGSKNRKKNTKLRTLTKEMDEAKTKIANPIMHEELDQVLIDFNNNKIGYKEALLKILDIRKKDYIADNVADYIDISRELLDPNELIDNLPSKYSNVKRAYHSLNKHRDQTFAPLDTLTDGEISLIVSKFRNSKLYKKISTAIKDLPIDQQLTIMKEMQDQFINKTISIGQLTKKALIDAYDANLIEQLNILNEASEESQKIFKTSMEQYEEAKRNFEETLGKNSSGENVKVDDEEFNNTFGEDINKKSKARVKPNDTSDIPDEDITDGIKDNKFANKKQGVNANLKAGEIANRPKINIYEKVDTDKNGVVAKLYDKVGTLRDGDYAEYISNDGYVTGLNKIGNQEYIYQYKPINKSEDVLGTKLYNVDDLYSVEDAYIVQLPSKSGDDIIRLQEDSARQFLLTKNANKISNRYMDNAIAIEIVRQQRVRDTAWKNKMNTTDIPTVINKEFAMNISRDIVNRIDMSKNRILVALNETFLNKTNGAMGLKDLFNPNMSVEEMTNLFLDDDIMNILLYLNRNGSADYNLPLGNMSLEDVKNTFGSELFDEQGNFKGIKVKGELDDTWYTYTTPEQVALYYAINEKNISQIIADSSLNENTQNLMRYFYEITPQEKINKAFIDGLPEEARGIFKSFDEFDNSMITTENMIKDLRDYIDNVDDMDLSKLNIINEQHPIFRVSKISNDVEDFVVDNFSKVGKRVGIEEHFGVFEYIGNSLYRDGYNKVEVLNQIMPIIDSVYRKFDLLQDLNFSKDVDTINAINVATRSSSKGSGKTYHLTDKEIDSLYKYGKNIDNKIYATKTTHINEIQLTPEQVKTSIEVNINKTLNSKEGQIIFKNNGQKVSLQRIKKITRSKWFKDLDEQIRFLYKDRADILDEWNGFWTNGKYSGALEKELMYLKNYPTPNGKVYDFQPNLMEDGIYIDKKIINFKTKKKITEVLDEYKVNKQRTPELIALIDQIENIEKPMVSVNDLGKKMENIQDISKIFVDKYVNNKGFTSDDIPQIKSLYEMFNKTQQKEITTWVNRGMKTNELPEAILNKIKYISTETYIGNIDDLFKIFDKEINRVNKNLSRAAEGKVNLRSGYNAIFRLKQAADLNMIELPDNVIQLINQFNNIGNLINSFSYGKQLGKPLKTEALHQVKGGRLTPREIAMANEALRSLNKSAMIENMEKLLNINYGVNKAKYNGPDLFSSQQFIERMQKFGLTKIKGKNDFAEALLNNPKYMDENYNLFLLGEDAPLTPERKALLDERWNDFKENIYMKYRDDFPQIEVDGQLRPPTANEFYVQMIYLMDDFNNSTSRTWMKDIAGIGSDYVHVGKIVNRFDDYKKALHFILNFGDDMKAIDTQGHFFKYIDSNIAALAEREAFGTDLPTLQKSIRRNIAAQRGNSYLVDETIRQANKAGFTRPLVQSAGEVDIANDVTLNSLADANIDYLDNLFYQRTKQHIPDDMRKILKGRTLEYFKDKKDLFLSWENGSDEGQAGRVIVGRFIQDSELEIANLNKYLYNNSGDNFKNIMNVFIDKGETLDTTIDNIGINLGGKLDNIYKDLNSYKDDSFLGIQDIMSGIDENLTIYKQRQRLTFGDYQSYNHNNKFVAALDMAKGNKLATIGAAEATLHDSMQFLQGHRVRGNIRELFRVIMNYPKRAGVGLGMTGLAYVDSWAKWGRYAAYMAGFKLRENGKLPNGKILRTLDYLANFPKLNEILLQSWINRGYNKLVKDQVQGALLNKIISHARKGDNGLVHAMNAYGRYVDNFQGPLELYKQVWALNHYAEAIGLDYNQLNNRLKVVLNAFGIKNKDWENLNNILMRVGSPKDLKKGGALFEFMGQSERELLEKGFTYDEIQSIKNLQGALNTAAFNEAHQNKRMLFQRGDVSAGSEEKVSELFKFTFFKTSYNASADFFHTAGTVADEDGYLFSNKEFGLAKGRMAQFGRYGRGLGMTAAIVVGGGLALNYVSPLVSYVRNPFDDKKKAKAIMQMHNNLYDPYTWDRWAMMSANAVGAGTIGFEFSSITSAVSMMLNDSRTAGIILSPLFTGRKTYAELFINNDMEKPVWLTSILGDKEGKLYNKVNQMPLHKYLEMVGLSVVSLFSEETQKYMNTMIYEDTYDGVEKTNDIYEAMARANGSASISKAERELQIDALTNDRTKSEFNIMDMAKVIVSPFIKTRQDAISDGNKVMTIEDADEEQQEIIANDAQNGNDYVISRQKVSEYLDSMKFSLVDLFSGKDNKDQNTDIDTNIDDIVTNPEVKAESNQKEKLLLFGMALQKYKTDNNGDLSKLTERNLDEYIELAKEDLKGGIVVGMSNAIATDYYDNKMNIIEAYENNYLMGVVPEKQLEKSFNDIFPKEEIQQRMDNLFTKEEQKWLKTNVLDVMGGNDTLNKAKLVTITEIMEMSDDEVTLNKIQDELGVDPNLVGKELSQEGVKIFRDNMQNEYGITLSDAQIKYLAYTGMTPDDLARARLQAEEFIQYANEAEQGKTDDVYTIQPKTQFDYNKIFTMVTGLPINIPNRNGILNGETNNQEFKQTEIKDKAEEYIGVKEPNNTQVDGKGQVPQLSPYDAAAQYTQADLKQAIDRIPKLHPNDKVKDDNMRKLILLAAPYSQKYNVPMELILAAFSIESGYGTKVKGKNNYFNITTGGKSWTGSYTTTYNKANGHTYHWRDYDNIEQGIEDYCKWWNRGKIKGVNRRNADGTINLQALKVYAEEGHYYNTIINQMNVMNKRMGSEVKEILNQSNLLAKEYPLDNIELQTYADQNVGSTKNDTLSLDTTLQMMGVQPYEEDIDEVLEAKGVHPLARRMIDEYRLYNPNTSDDRVAKYNIVGAGMPNVDASRDLGWDASIISYIGSDYITSKSISAEQLYRNNGIEIKPNEPLESGDLVFLDNKDGDIFHVNVVVAALNNGTIITISGNENDEGMGIKAYNRSDIKKAKRLPKRDDGTVSGARKEIK